MSADSLFAESIGDYLDINPEEVLVTKKLQAFDKIAARFDSYFNEEVSQTKATELLMEILAIIRLAKKDEVK